MSTRLVEVRVPFGWLKNRRKDLEKARRDYGIELSESSVGKRYERREARERKGSRESQAALVSFSRAPTLNAGVRQSQSICSRKTELGSNAVSRTNGKPEDD